MAKVTFDPAELIDKGIALLPPDVQDDAKNARKAIVSGIGALLTVLGLTASFGFIIPEKYRKPIGIVMAVLAAILTYVTPNAPAPVSSPVPVSGA
jgi:hypothetical protein